MYKDTRLFGTEKWYHTKPKGADMRIPDEMTKSVCFLCVQLKGGKDAGKYKPIGTGVFIGIRQDDWDFLYLVTARHVLDIRTDMLPIYARINTKDGASRYIEMPPLNLWSSFQNHAIDVAALSLQITEQDLIDWDFAAIPFETLLDEQTIEKHSIGLGDDLFVIGLHVHHSGSKQNIPILRTGIIAMMPNEPIYDRKNNGKHHCYFVELRSIGGLSGSPVYVYIDRYRTVDPKLEDGDDWKWAFIGTIRGHHKLPKSIVDSDADSDLILEDNWLGIGVGEDLNVGIALVTPSQYLITLLMDGDKTRKAAVNKYNEIYESTEDSDLPESAFTQDIFQNALQKASRKISLPEKEKKETLD